MIIEEQDKELFQERYSLAFERLKEIPSEDAVKEPFRSFFVKEAEFLCMLLNRREELYDAEGRRRQKDVSFEELQAFNKKMYADILPEAYPESYGDPDYAEKMLGREYGRLFGWLYAELRGAIPFAYENRPWDLTVLAELFLEIYGAFSGEEPAAPAQLKSIIYAYNYDYCADFTRDRIAEQIDPSYDFAKKIIMESDLNDLRYLFEYGLYISDNEIRTASFLNTLQQDEIEAMASTYTEGYRMGFEKAGIDLSKKKTVNIRYFAGFERMIRAAVLQFEKMGLDSVIYRVQSRSTDSWSPRKNGYDGGDPNPQFFFDHCTDHGIYLDEKMLSAKLAAMTQAFESMKELANTHAGPAVIETFGAALFNPKSKDSVKKLTPEQQELMVRYNSEAGQITKRYIIGEERSFTIIAYPVPDIGENFEEIFKETVRINTLDYRTYENIQQKLIDALDEGDFAVVKGTNGNETDLKICLQVTKDPSRQTKFENCVADVNIPVGEVFTSPLLEGTTGLLHVKQVYLEGLNYIDLKIRLKDGMIEDYTCSNFDTEEKNRKYIEEHILFNHPTLPIGEFAIGTNTTAYEVGRRFRIMDKMPILIYEKTGPHFAFGDTCFSWQEELHTYNPDGKEMIAKDNACSILRKTDPSKAYFGCHTDITIPYDELGYIRAVKKDGTEISLIENGLFTLEGCEELNEALYRALGSN